MAGKTGRVACAAFTIVASAASSASAQEDIDAERFKPAVTHDGFINAEGTAVRPSQDPLELGAFVNYQRNSLVTVDGSGDLQDQLVSGRMGLDLFGSLTIGGPFAVGGDLPLYLLQTGDADPSFGGLGDFRLVPKLRVLDDRDLFGLAVLAEVRLPTHTGDFSGGARNVAVVPKVAVDHRFLNGVRIGFNLGAVIREETTFANVDAGSELLYAGALGYRFGGYGGKTEIGAELDGSVGFSDTSTEELPLEALLYVKHDVTEEWVVQGGPGIGLVPGYGVPIFRVFAGVLYRPTVHDADHDGIPDDDDQCPNEAEDRDGEQDSDGCPEEDLDTDQDGVPDKQDQCPEAKETINGHEDDDGCPDSGDPRVIYEDGKFKILDRVHFETGSAKISEDSHSLLDQVALTVKANPDVKVVRIEGHTDSRGDADMNRRLSQSRAESVRQYLIGKGISGSRLKAVGHGEDKPLERGESDDANAKNRRVEFVVEGAGGDI